jgi:ParB/RepB/Spo0J family partition protein
MSLLTVRLEEVRPDPKQPRTYFKKSALQALARSIQLAGQITPIHVRKLPAGEQHRYEIIDGERRWRAHRIAGKKTIKATVEEAELDDRRRHLLSTISNFQREGHTHMEISDALAYQRSLGESAPVLAENLAKSEGWVYQYLSLQKLSPDMRDKLHPETDDDELLRVSEALVLASLTHAQQHEVYRQSRRQERGARLNFMRARAATLQGKERFGRPSHAAEREASIERKFYALMRQMDLVLDLKERDFETMLSAAEPQRVKALEARLAKLESDAAVMLAAVRRAKTHRKAA